MRPSRVPGLTLAIAGIAASLLLGACASSASSVPGGAEAPPVNRGPDAAPTAAPSAAPAAPYDVAGGTGGTGGSSAGDPSGQDGNDAAAPNGPSIIKTGSLALEVKDLDAALLQSRGRIVGLGGYVSDSERSNAGESSTALITYRIPAARWDEALDALRGFATRIVNENTKAVDVTGQVLDLGARIDNLKATERALQAIMAQATKISDILDVQTQLTTVRGEIEQLSTQQAHLNDQAAMGTLAVTYTLPVVAVAQATSGFNFSAEVDRAVAQLVQLGQGLAVLGVWLIVVGLPVLLGILLLVGLAALLVRRFTSRGERPVPAA